MFDLQTGTQAEYNVAPTEQATLYTAKDVESTLKDFNSTLQYAAKKRVKAEEVSLENEYYQKASSYLAKARNNNYSSARQEAEMTQLNAEFGSLTPDTKNRINESVGYVPLGKQVARQQQREQDSLTDQAVEQDKQLVDFAKNYVAGAGNMSRDEQIAKAKELDSLSRNYSNLVSMAAALPDKEQQEVLNKLGDSVGGQLQLNALAKGFEQGALDAKLTTTGDFDYNNTYTSFKSFFTNVFGNTALAEKTTKDAMDLLVGSAQEASAKYSASRQAATVNNIQYALLKQIPMDTMKRAVESGVDVSKLGPYEMKQLIEAQGGEAKLTDSEQRNNLLVTSLNISAPDNVLSSPEQKVEAVNQAVKLTTDDLKNKKTPNAYKNAYTIGQKNIALYQGTQDDYVRKGTAKNFRTILQDYSYTVVNTVAEELKSFSFLGSRYNAVKISKDGEITFPHDVSAGKLVGAQLADFTKLWQEGVKAGLIDGEELSASLNKEIPQHFGSQIGGERSLPERIFTSPKVGSGSLIEETLMDFEDVVPKAYKDTSSKEYVTVGVGRNLETKGLSKEEYALVPDYDKNLFEESNGRFIIPRKNREAALSSFEASDALINKMLSNDIADSLKELPAYDTLTEGAQAMLISVKHQVGKQFTNMDKAISKKEYPLAIAEVLLSKRSIKVNVTRAGQELYLLAGDKGKEIYSLASLFYNHALSIKDKDKRTAWLSEAAKSLSVQIEPYVYK